MGKLIAIDKLYMNKIPNSCKECPLTYLDTGDDAYFGANERRCVIDDSCIDGMVSERAYDCPLVEAIPKDEYENRLKADMVAMLTELQLEIEEEKTNTEHLHYDELEQAESYNNSIDNCIDSIQQRINELKETKDDKYKSHESIK